MTDEQRFEAGLQARREVLGATHVDRSLAKATEFAQPMQELVTEYCWGEIWTRPGLSRRDRSLLNLGMLTALNRNDELKVHVRGALNNGCSVEEIQEVLLQTAIYCGVPAALASFRAAQVVIDEMAQERPQGETVGKPSP
jgi:4-carboxymuconolactone decarboxylase